jgi:hypothetical protein
MRYHLLKSACAVALLAASAGCLTVPAPTPVSGPETAVQRLAGEWTGYYVGTKSHRSGAISFSLQAGDTTAYGEVVMVPREYWRYDPARERSVRVTPPPVLLTVTFVRVMNGEVTGVLEPYSDPDCDCLVVTTFTGQMTTPHTITGTFATRIVGTSAQQSGRWQVTRRKGA